MYKKVVSIVLLFALTIGVMTPVSAAANGSLSERSEAASAFELYESDIAELYPNIELSDSEQNCLSASELPVGNLSEIMNVNISNEFTSINGSDQSRRSASTITRGGTWIISENTMYADSLVSADDYTVYLCVITSNCEATAFIQSTSKMDYILEVLVFTNTNMNVQRTDGFSAVNGSPYSGQSVRRQVYAGEVLAILVAKNPNSTFISNSYNVAVLTQASMGDANNNPDDATWHSISQVANVLQGNSIQLDTQYDVDWYVFNYLASSTHYPTIAFSSGSYSITATVYTRGSNGQLTKVKDLINDGEFHDIRNLTTQTYYIAVYSTSNSIYGYYALATQLRPVHIVEKLVKITLEAYGDTYSPNSFGGYGPRPTSRYQATVVVTIKDTKGNLISNFPVAASFDSGYLGPIAADTLTTNSNGTASTVLTLTVLPSDYFIKYRVSSNTVHLYHQAKAQITLPQGYSCTNSTDAYVDMYHFGGTTI